MNQFLRNFSIYRVDFILLLPAVILVGISLATLYSIDNILFRQQLVAFAVGLVIYFVFLSVDINFIRHFSKQIYIGMLVCLVLLFLIGIEAKGAVRWIDVFGIRLQFSEIFKPFFIIVLANYLTRDDTHSLGKFISSLLLLFPVFFLVLRQPDLGNAIIYGIATICVMVIYGFPWRYFLGLGTVTILPMPIFFSFLHGYQRQRIFSFFNSTSDPFGSSYNAIQSLISVGSGGFFGKGFGQATQSILRFLPERHTDFIFATISESLGFIGGMVVLALFIFLLARIYRIALSSRDSFAYLVSLGLFFVLLTHVFFNIGMNLGIVPIVGITLPLVSYGGSSLLTNFLVLSILSSIRSDEKKKGPFEIS